MEESTVAMPYLSLPHLSRRTFLANSAVAGGAAALNEQSGLAAAAQPVADRDYLLSVLLRIAQPVLTSLSQRRLKLEMPVEAPHGNADERRRYTYLEALGRLLSGMAPWLETPAQGAEELSRIRYCDLARRSIAAAVDKSSPDFMNFDNGQQPVVDAAFLALAVLRAPTELWHKLDDGTKNGLVEALRSSRKIRPSFSNWLLFSATVEAFLCFAGEPWDLMRVDYAVRKIDEWYKGDGIYGDGPQLHWDYYNSFVIHPMLLQVLTTVGAKSNDWKTFEAPAFTRAKRYAALQERMIGPDGAYPVTGRSITYRFGAFHLLADMALRGQLPDAVTPEQVRCALTAVVRRMIEAPGTFDEHGWLRVGFCGHQPSLGEPYISTGSLYLCTAGLLPLGLAASDRFWSAPPQPWTGKKVWSGEDVPADHAI